MKLILIFVTYCRSAAYIFVYIFRALKVRYMLNLFAFTFLKFLYRYGIESRYRNAEVYAHYHNNNMNSCKNKRNALLSLIAITFLSILRLSRTRLRRRRVLGVIFEYFHFSTVKSRLK